MRLRGTNNGIIDLAGNNITNYNVDHTSVPSSMKEGYNALKFNGNDAYLLINLNDYIHQSEDFTVSFWIIEQIVSSKRVNAYFTNLTQDNTSSPFYICAYNYGSHPYDAIEYYGAGYAYYSGLFNLSSPVYYTCCRKNNTMFIFINGELKTQFAETNNCYIDPTLLSRIGYDPSAGGASYKYSRFTLDDYCIIKGKALWTSNFTPPTTYLPDKI